MTNTKDHSNAELASRLSDHADSITNVAAHEMEQDIRLAAERLRRADEPAAPIPSLVTELRKLWETTTDAVTRQRIRALLGEP